MDGFDTARWYYYYFEALDDRHEIPPLENYSVHPTLYNLNLLKQIKNSDTIRYFIRRSFVSMKIPCINKQDIIQIYMTTDRMPIFSITEYGTDLISQTTFDLRSFKHDQGLLKKIDTFLLDYGTEVNPWFQKEARRKGFKICGYYNNGGKR